ncbi:hypothetical protein OR986_21080 [Burkholderia ambifaria]|nr:hypothetical protein [Burkholderia ambifaria]WDR88399.1 hypothetical protein OR986_21080 [Burkholderia ambifaria]WDS01145.1 hypothetical protein OR985_26080 [Burkholderia ambifaria]
MRFDRMRCSFVEAPTRVKRIRLNRVRYFVFQCIWIASGLAGQGFSAINPLYLKGNASGKISRRAGQTPVGMAAVSAAATPLRRTDFGNHDQDHGRVGRQLALGKGRASVN